jgi:hypothetical protein
MLSIHNSRMFELLKYAKANGIISTDKEFAEAIGITRPNLVRAANGNGNFTVAQMIAACELTGASMDYICGFQDHMMRKSAAITPVQLMEEALRLLKSSPKTALPKKLPKRKVYNVKELTKSVSANGLRRKKA